MLAGMFPEKLGHIKNCQALFLYRNIFLWRSFAWNYCSRTRKHGPTLYILRQQGLTYSLTFVNSIPGVFGNIYLLTLDNTNINIVSAPLPQLQITQGMVLARIECKVHIALSKRPIKLFKQVQQADNLSKSLLSSYSTELE